MTLRSDERRRRLYAVDEERRQMERRAVHDLDFDALRDTLRRAEVDIVLRQSFKVSAHRWPDWDIREFAADCTRAAHHANIVLRMLGR